jgi:type IV pilus assembly protein PilQ
LKNRLSYLLLIFALLLNAGNSFAQKEERVQAIEEKLKELSKSVPGLNENVDFSLTGVTIQEFLRAVSESHNLNVSIDPVLNFKIYYNFTNEKVINVLLFLVKEYDLDINFIGTIMAFHPYVAPTEKVVIKQKDVVIKYNTYNDLLTLDLKNDTLDKVAKKITQETKKNVVFAPGLGAKIVSVYIEDMPFDKAMEKFAFSNSLRVTKTEDGSFVLQNLQEGEDIDFLTNNNNNNKKKRTPVKSATANPGASVPYIEITSDSAGVPLISFEANNVSLDLAIKLVTDELDIPFMLYSEVKGTVSTNLSRVPFDVFLTYLLQGTDYTYKKENNIYLVGDRKLEGLRANRVFQFQYRTYSDVQEVIPAEIKKGVEIKEFKELNSILMTGSLPQIVEVEAFLKKLDRVVPVVTIEVIMIDIRKQRNISTGISAGLSDTIKTGGTLLPGINFVFSSKSINSFLDFLGANSVMNIGHVTPNFYMQLKALEANNNVDVRQVPRVSTLNAHDANLSIGSQRYYSIQKSNVIGTGLTPTVTNVQEWVPVQANLSIKLTPVVSADDQVTLTIDVHISDFLTAPSANAPPASSNSQFTSTLRVRNEEMIVLGGIERMEKSDNTSGVPILSRIPILKWIFSNRTKSRNKIISIVFIKPTITY